MLGKGLPWLGMKEAHFSRRGGGEQKNHKSLNSHIVSQSEILKIVLSYHILGHQNRLFTVL